MVFQELVAGEWAGRLHGIFRRDPALDGVAVWMPNFLCVQRQFAAWRACGAAPHGGLISVRSSRWTGCSILDSGVAYLDEIDSPSS